VAKVETVEMVATASFLSTVSTAIHTATTTMASIMPIGPTEIAMYVTSSAGARLSIETARTVSSPQSAVYSFLSASSPFAAVSSAEVVATEALNLAHGQAAGVKAVEVTAATAARNALDMKM